MARFVARVQNQLSVVVIDRGRKLVLAVMSWTALAGAVAFAALSARSWVRAVRYWRDATAPTSVMAFSRLLGPKSRRRLECGCVLDAVCLSGLTLLLLGGVWLPPAGSPAAANPVALGIATAGLTVFLLGLVAQISLVFWGRPSFVIPKHAKGEFREDPPRRDATTSGP
ncbi:hypothetical protein [Streptomyces fuscichromogenes]|uniref:hypothetical protein n=1 Tax=Streptomyces fuscichromogenes TaxID=1324013 RepID=UPI001670C503|nr:hypothetical protein [Streptomyces fuscichromogenes]